MQIWKNVECEMTSSPVPYSLFQISPQKPATWFRFHVIIFNPQANTRIFPFKINHNLFHTVPIRVYRHMTVCGLRLIKYLSAKKKLCKMNTWSIAYKLELTKYEYLCTETVCEIRTRKYSARIPTHASFHVTSQTLRTNAFRSPSGPSILINRMH